MRALHPLFVTLLLPASALLGGCQEPNMATSQGVAAQIIAFETQIQPLQAAIEAQLRGQPSSLGAASADHLSRLQASLGTRAAGLEVAERVQLIRPEQVQRAAPGLRGLMVLSLPAQTLTGQTPTGLTWAATLTLDLNAKSVLESVLNTELTQRYQPAHQLYPQQPGGRALLRFVAGTLGVYPPRISLGTLSAVHSSARTVQAIAAQDTATVAEYAETGALLSVR